MPSIRGLEANEVGIFTRFLYWMTKRKVRRVIVPFKVTAHHPRLLLAMGQMEMGQAAAHAVDHKLKELAGIKAATLVGCPF
jgi:hypothetical protein